MQESEYIYCPSNQHKAHASLEAFQRARCPSGKQHQQQGGGLLAVGWHSTHTGSEASRQKTMSCWG